MKKLFTLFVAIVVTMTVKAKVIDFTATATAITDWTVTEATLNSSSDESAGKYVYDIMAGVPCESYVSAEPNVVFLTRNANSKDKAFAIYPGQCYEFGSKNGILIIKNTNAGDPIKLTVAAKGSTSSNFEGEGFPVNASIVSTDLTLPSKGSEGCDEKGYVWKEIEYISFGGEVQIKEFAGGYRIRKILVGYDFYVTTNSTPIEGGIVYYDIQTNIMTATPNYGYHFVRWNDGNTNNPRTITVMQDTTFTAEFAKNPSVTYIFNSQMGDVSGPTMTKTGVAADSITFNATAYYGYHFTQWSDGVTENPRTIWLSQDTTFMAEFALDRTGTCGTDLALMWTYEPETKVLTISGNGSFNDNMQCGVEARSALHKVVFTDGVISIGTSAFANCTTLQTLVLSKDVKKINENAFYNCDNLTAIYNYRPTPTNIYANTFSGVDKFECVLYVPDGSADMYKSDGSNWKDFYFIESMASTGDEYTVTYIDKDEELIDSEKIKLHLPEAPEIEGFTFLGWRPVATFIESNTIVIEAVYESEGGTDLPAEVSAPTNPAQKLIRQGNVYILTGDKTYTITGQKVK